MSQTAYILKYGDSAVQFDAELPNGEKADILMPSATPTPFDFMSVALIHGIARLGRAGMDTDLISAHPIESCQNTQPPAEPTRLP